ncbi:MAG: aldo/keto reductase [Bdellovibrionaceae bacterium]|nr:aldo/keto reductase [Pseudobdellovibrionaceae bacterium]
MCRFELFGKTFTQSCGLKVLSPLDKVSKNEKCSIATASLAWLISRPVITSPIVSATSVAQMKDMIAASDLKLSADSLGLLDQASDPRI